VGSRIKIELKKKGMCFLVKIKIICGLSSVRRRDREKMRRRKREDEKEKGALAFLISKRLIFVGDAMCA
jgi:hypothetical protein